MRNCLLALCYSLTTCSLLLANEPAANDAADKDSAVKDSAGKDSPVKDSANWPRWRGPEAIGSTTTGEYPTSWSAEKNLAWKVKLPGRGCSTPIVWNGQILITSAIAQSNGVTSFDMQGRQLWQTKLAKQRPGRHRNGSGANPSPVTDGKYIFLYFKSGQLAALDMSGKLLWETNLIERYGKDTLYWDHGISPVITEQAVVMTMMHEGDSFLAAFDKATGKLIWKTKRKYECPQEGDHSYATPTVIHRNGEQRIITWGAEHVTSHRARDGKLLWECGGFNPEGNRLWVSVASAVVVNDLVVVPYGRGSRLAAVQLGGKGDVTQENRVWTREDTGAFVPTPAASAGKLYLLRDKGEVSRLDAKTGKTEWSQQLPKSRNKYYASPTIADGKLYAAREDGVVFVARINGEFEVLSENKMNEQIIASPVPVAGRLLLRGETHLFCVQGD